MSDGTGIEWTDATWNVASGCTRVSEGCDHCYIERTPPFRMQHRRFDGDGPGSTTGVGLHPERLNQPLRWRKPRRVFVNSLTDLFHQDIPDEYIARVFAVMALAPQHTFQVLTKRHGRMRSLLCANDFRAGVTTAQIRLSLGHRQPLSMTPWPLPNVWVGVSVETQQWADIRIPALLDTPAAVRFLSCEPLLGQLKLPSLLARGEVYPSQIDWVICGGESGPGARPMHPDWARSLRDQCVAAGVPFLFKQWGAWTPDLPDNGVPARNCLRYADVRQTEVYRIGKKRAGRVLDGRTWTEFPHAD